MAQPPRQKAAAAAHRPPNVTMWRIATAGLCIVALALWSWTQKGNKQDANEGIESVLARRDVAGQFSSLQDVSTLRRDDEV